MSDDEEAAPAPAPEEVIPTPAEEVTDAHDLRALAAKAATARRRGLHGELTVRRAEEQEVRVPLDRGETVIGRDPICDIVVEGEGVSRRHACVRRTAGGYFELRDLGSRNGTLVQGLPTQSYLLMDGDRFQVGTTRFVVHFTMEDDGV